MNKRDLAKVPRPAPMPAEVKYQPSERFITTEDLTVGDEQVLVLNVFMQEKGCTDLVCIYRTFMTPDDYITQDLRTDKTKWATGAFLSSVKLNEVAFLKLNDAVFQAA